MKKLFKMLMLMFLSVALLTGCGGLDDVDDYTEDEPTYIGDVFGTDILIRDGEFVDVVVTTDREAIYFYLDDDTHELLDTAILPMADYTDNWYISEIDTNDITGNHYSDLIVHIIHSDTTETTVWYVWNENDHFLYQEFYSRFKQTPGYDEDVATDYSAYAGYWVATSDNMYEGYYMDIDLEGNWKLCAGEDIVDEGYLYIVEGEGIRVYSYETGAIHDGSVELEDDYLYINTAGYFEYTNDINAN